MAASTDGGPAFPRDERFQGHNGMSLRDWFAGQALAGIMANSERWRDIARRYDRGKMTYDDASNSNAAKAYNIADAMLRARGDG